MHITFTSVLELSPRQQLRAPLARDVPDVMLLEEALIEWGVVAGLAVMINKQTVVS